MRKRTKIGATFLLCLTLFTALFLAVGCNNGGEEENVSITLSPTQITILEYEEEVVTATLTGAEGSITWESSDESVVIVENGHIYGTGEGSATVTARYGDAHAECAVTVTDSPYVPTLRLNADPLTLKRGAEYTIEPAIYLGSESFALPADTAVTSSAEVVTAVLAVDGSVVITAAGVTSSAAEVKISCTWRGVLLEQTLSVTVVEDAAIELSETALSLHVYDADGSLNEYGVYASRQITASVYYEGVEQSAAQVTYASDNQSVATVSADGTVIAAAAGSANITVTWQAPSGIPVTAVCAVTVTVGEVDIGDTVLYKTEADGAAEIDLSEYISAVTAVQASDVTGEAAAVTASAEGSKIVFERASLTAGLRRLRILCDEKIAFTADAEVITRVIGTADELINITSYAQEEGSRLTGYFVLGGNIDLTGKSVNAHESDPTGAEYTGAEIGFAGTLDGRGYTVYGGTYYKNGIFGYSVAANAVIKNVAFTGITLGGVYGTLATVIGNDFYGRAENVLVDVVKNDSGWGTVFQFMYGTLVEFVAYAPAANAEPAYAICWYPGIAGSYTVENAYSIGGYVNPNNNYSADSGYYSHMPVNEFAYGTDCSAVGFTGFDETYWCFDGEKAYFKSFLDMLESGLSAIPETLLAGKSAELPVLPGITYTESSDYASISGNTLTIAAEIPEDFTLTLVADFSTYGAQNVEVEISIKAIVNIVVEDAQRYEMYSSLQEGVRQANSADFTIDISDELGGSTLPTGMTWSLGGQNVTDYVDYTAAGVITFDPVSAGAFGGVYTLEGVAAEETIAVSVSVLLINKIITTANDLLHFGDYGDKTAQTTAEKSFTLRNPNNSNIPGWEGQSETVQKTMDVYVLHGYFELGANIDLTGVTFNQYANFTANCGDSDTTASYGFAGVFDGMGYILSGGTYLEGGMFGAIAAGGIVRNVAIMNATLSASDIYYYGYTGSVIGETFAGTLDNVLIEVVGIDSGETVRGRAYGSGIAQAVRGGVITNSILYFNTMTEGSAPVSLGVYGQASSENFYVFAVTQLGTPNVLGGTSYYAAVGDGGAYATSVAGLELTGFNEYWLLTQSRAQFRNVYLDYAETLRGYDFPSELTAGGTLQLPELPLVTYTENSDYASISGNTLTVADTVPADETLTVTADFTAYSQSAAPVQIQITLKQSGSIIVAEVQEYERYISLIGGEPQANTADFTIDIAEQLGGTDISQFTWKIGETDVSSHISVQSGVITADVNGLRTAGFTGGEYVLIGSNADSSFTVRVNILIADKIITAPYDLIHITDYAEESGSLLTGYFVLGGNIDLTDESVNAHESDPTGTGYTGAEIGFAGTFDGRGYTVNGGTYYKNGIFGYSVAADAVIKNVAFTNVALNGTYNTSFATVIGNDFYGRAENILVDVTSNSGYGTIFQFMYGTLVDFVAYAPTGLGDPCYAICTFPGTNKTATNVYSIGGYNNRADCGYYTSLGANEYAFGTTCDQIDFTGLDPEYWDLSGDKAAFIAKD